MRYQYSAKNSQNQISTGFVNANSPAEATTQLESLQFQVDYLKEVSESEGNKSNYSKYKFRAKNKENKTVKGTIEATDMESGIRRLMKEYDLDIELFGDQNLSDQDLELNKGSIQELIADIKTRPINEKTSKSEDLDSQENSEFQVSKKIDYVENLISMVNYILNRFDSYLKNTSKSELQETLNIFEKTRYSENKEQMQNQAKSLIKEILNDELFKESFDFNDSPEINNLHTQATTLLLLSFKNPAQKAIQILSLLFTTKSNLTRQILIKKIQNSILKIFKQKLKSNKLDVKKDFTNLLSINTTIEKKLYDIVFIVTQAYLGFYFLAYLVGSKLEYNFNIFESQFIIYAILASLFIQAALKFDLLINKVHKLKSIYLMTVFLLLYIALIWNL